MKKTYQRPHIDVLYMNMESLLQSGSVKAIDERGTDRPGDSDNTPGGGGSVLVVGEDEDEGITVVSKGGSLWDDWE